MQEIERFSNLIGNIYDASLDPALWPGVFKAACGFIGGSAASLVSQDTIRRTAHIYYSWGTDPHYDQLYCEKYCKLDPIFPSIFFFDVEETHSVSDCLPREEFCRTRFSREWLNPQGLVDGLFSNLEKSPTSCAIFTVARTIIDGLVDDEMRRRYELVVPHMRRALLIGEVIDLKKVEAAALADSLDTLSSGMFLVNVAGRIVHANISGHLMVSERKVLRALGGKLGAIDPLGDQALLDAFTAAAAGDAALGRMGIAVPLKGRGMRAVRDVPRAAAARPRAGSGAGLEGEALAI
jgi:hypothetical protein